MLVKRLTRRVDFPLLSRNFQLLLLCFVLTSLLRSFESLVEPNPALAKFAFGLSEGELR